MRAVRDENKFVIDADDETLGECEPLEHADVDAEKEALLVPARTDCDGEVDREVEMVTERETDGDADAEIVLHADRVWEGDAVDEKQKEADCETDGELVSDRLPDAQLLVVTLFVTEDDPDGDGLFSGDADSREDLDTLSVPLTLPVPDADRRILADALVDLDSISVPETEPDPLGDAVPLIDFREEGDCRALMLELDEKLGDLDVIGEVDGERVNDEQALDEREIVTDGVAVKLHDVDLVEVASLVAVVVIDTDAVAVIDVELEGDTETDPVALLVGMIERVLDANDEVVAETDGEPLVAKDDENTAVVDNAAEVEGDTDPLRDVLGDGVGERLIAAEVVTRTTEFEAAAEMLALGLGLLDEEGVFETVGEREPDEELDGDGVSVGEGDSEGDPELAALREANDADAQADTETLGDANAEALDECDADTQPETEWVTEPLEVADRDA